jgi:hypothetical protein
MNERIRELAEQAGMVKTLEEHAREYGNGMFENTPYPELEYLAELIVLECLSIVKSNTYGPNGEYDYSYSDEDSAADRRARTIYEEIAYRFGVEE